MSPQLSICIVSSDQPTIIMLRFMFMAMGLASPRCFKDPQSAWRYINAEIPDLILADCRSDPVSVRRLMERVRTSKKASTVPIIALTALNSEPCWQEAIKAGATESLFTPFNIVTLHGAVETALFQQEKKNDARDLIDKIRRPAR